ncbi:MAG TPA: hypothetical protein VLK35_17240 [Methylomirabilota bacterium]|nr:hypothetical protein [Methylomirabilota bacterium]
MLDERATLGRRLAAEGVGTAMLLAAALFRWLLPAPRPKAVPDVLAERG